MAQQSSATLAQAPAVPPEAGSPPPQEAPAAGSPADVAPPAQEPPSPAEAEPGAALPQPETPSVQSPPPGTEVVPGAPVSEPGLGPISDWGIVAGIAVFALLVLFFVWALVKARRRRRAELAGEEAPTPAATSAGFPETAPPGGLPARPEQPVPPPGPPPTEKAARREAFLEQQRLAREAREAEAAQRQAEAEAARRAAEEAEEAARRAAEEEAARRREALLAPSGPLTQSLSRTRGGFAARLNSLLGKQMDESALEELEEVLFTADIGVSTAARLLETVRESARRKDLSDPERFRAAVRKEIVTILGGNGASSEAEGLDPSRAPERPYVVMVVGVNGVGKTTTIGKLAGRLIARGHKVVLAAGDTFRAAAVEQLEVWGDRVGAEVVRGDEGADPGSVVFEAVSHARAVGADVVIADTAGRLHTKVPLMEELKKVHRVLGKARDGAPDDVLLVVDATTGQNAIQQAKLFREAVPITAIALTKLDGTAKGGVVIGISDELNIPVRYIGVGEKVGDLRPFDPRQFVDALFG